MFGSDYSREKGGKGKGGRGALLPIDIKLVTDQCVSTR